MSTHPYRPNLSFEMLGIRVGDTLTVINRPDETCIVVSLSPPVVVYRRQVMSLSAAINAVYGMTYNDPASAWAFNGETLSQRRDRFEVYHRRLEIPR